MSIEYHHCQLFLSAPAIKQLALRRLNNAVDNYFVNSPKQQVYSMSPSYRSKGCCQVVYVSNVAFIFSNFLNIPPLEIANSFAIFYAQRSELLQDFKIDVVPPGFLQLTLTEPKLAHWLQCLPLLALQSTNLPSLENSSPVHNNLNLFAIQYAHARCYGVMQLAQREGLINLEEISAQQVKSMFPDLTFPAEKASILIINQPQPLPWLNCSQKLYFCHQAEYALIVQLVKVVDDFYYSKKSSRNFWLKTALNLSQAFADFYSHCRIFGETSAQTPKLAQGRLGLTLATYVALKVLLERLGEFTPQQL